MKLKQKHLYFICPTDHLEPTINRLNEQKNYYYTSLGNSVVFNNNKINQIELLILEHNIKKVSFVLSNNNLIIQDALGSQNFTEVKILGDYCNEITKQKKFSDIFWNNNGHKSIVLSNYLNKKINELQFMLNDLILDQIEIDGKIYNEQENVFNSIYKDLKYNECFSLN